MAALAMALSITLVVSGVSLIHVIKYVRMFSTRHRDGVDFTKKHVIRLVIELGIFLIAAGLLIFWCVPELVDFIRSPLTY